MCRLSVLTNLILTPILGDEYCCSHLTDEQTEAPEKQSNLSKVTGFVSRAAGPESTQPAPEAALLATQMLFLWAMTPLAPQRHSRRRAPRLGVVIQGWAYASLRTFLPKSLSPDAFVCLFPISPQSVPKELCSLSSFHFLFCTYRCAPALPRLQFPGYPRTFLQAFPTAVPSLALDVFAPPITAPHLPVDLDATLPVNPPWLSLLERITPGPPVCFNS